MDFNFFKKSDEPGKKSVGIVVLLGRDHSKFMFDGFRGLYPKMSLFEGNHMSHCHVLKKEGDTQEIHELVSTLQKMKPTLVRLSLESRLEEDASEMIERLRSEQTRKLTFISDFGSPTDIYIQEARINNVPLAHSATFTHVSQSFSLHLSKKEFHKTIPHYENRRPTKECWKQKKNFNTVVRNGRQNYLFH
jgi:hypothetical protein